MSQKCVTCGTENEDIAKKCTKCGTFLNAKALGSAGDQVSEDEVPPNLVIALVGASLPLFCCLAHPLALVAVPIGIYGVLQAQQVEKLLKRRDVMGATAASLMAKRAGFGAMLAAVVLGAIGFMMQAREGAENVGKDRIDQAMGEATAPSDLGDPAEPTPPSGAAPEAAAAPAPTE